MPQHSPDPTPWYERRLWQITPVRDAIWIALTAGAVVTTIWLGYELRAIFTPVLVALALAYLFDPIITRCERQWNVPRPATISAIVAVMVVVTLCFAWWLGPKLVGQIKDLAVAAPGYLDRVAKESNVELDKETHESLQRVSKDPMAFLADKASVLIAGTGVAVGFIGHLIGKTLLIGVTLALIPIYFFFFAWQFGPLTQYFHQYIPDSREERVMQILGRMDRIVAAYFRARVVIALLMGAMLSIGWALADVDYWLLLGMGVGMMSLIPYASVVGWPLAVAIKWLAMTNGEEAPGFEVWAIFVWPSVVYLVVQFIESWLLTPWIQGKSMDMSAVTILIVVFVGGALGGLYGLILCIPMAACVKILMLELVLPRIRAWAAKN